MMRNLLYALAVAAILAACVAPDPRRNDAHFARVETGMTQAQVRDLAGPPDNIMPFPMSGNTGWGWLYWDQFGYYVEFSVTFAPDGRVASKSYRRLNEGGDHGH